MIRLVVATFVILLASNAHSALVVEWELWNDKSEYGVGDAVTQYGHIKNLPQNSGLLIRGNIKNASLSTVAGYDGVLGSDGTDFFSQFDSMSIGPGGTFDFIFATYTPNSSNTGGVHAALQQTIYFQNAFPALPDSLQPDRSRDFISNSIQWTVVDPVVTPEPSSLLLLGVGGAALSLMRRKKM